MNYLSDLSLLLNAPSVQHWSQPLQKQSSLKYWPCKQHFLMLAAENLKRRGMSIREGLSFYGANTRGIVTRFLDGALNRPAAVSFCGGCLKSWAVQHDSK